MNVANPGKKCFPNISIFLYQLLAYDVTYIPSRDRSWSIHAGTDGDLLDLPGSTVVHAADQLTPLNPWTSTAVENGRADPPAQIPWLRFCWLELCSLRGMTSITCLSEVWMLTLHTALQHAAGCSSACFVCSVCWHVWNQVTSPGSFACSEAAQQVTSCKCLWSHPSPHPWQLPLRKEVSADAPNCSWRGVRSPETCLEKARMV